ncbi:MAG: helix-turn-helix transcriptional regulator [Candidatus Obscuribacterales bacterium]|nr:helix-turn-helix transcriptional regulator [Candidatus Obscuribacterales bacterium]
MIKSEREYQATERSLVANKRKKDFLECRFLHSQDPKIKAQIILLEKEITSEEELLINYLAAWFGRTKLRSLVIENLTAINDIQTELIRARIILRWTRQHLAAKSKISVRQIADYERSNYSTASLATIQKISTVLCHELKGLEQKVT